MSWLFSQALVEGYSADICSDGVPSAQLNVMPTPHKFWRNDKTIEFSNLSRFGLTLQLLTENRGKELLMLFLEDFRAKTSVLLGGQGITGERSGLWKEQKRIIGEVDPEFAWMENSPMLTIRGLGTVLGDLAELGFDAEWGVLSARDVGAIHLRKRIWILASNNRKKRIQGFLKSKVFRQSGVSWSENVRGLQDLRNRSDIPEPLICRKSNGIPDYVDRISEIGNAQFPGVAATAFTLLRERLEK